MRLSVCVAKLILFIGVILCLSSLAVSCAKTEDVNLDPDVVDDVCQLADVIKEGQATYHNVYSFCRYMTKHRCFKELVDVVEPFFESEVVRGMNDKYLLAMAGVYLAQSYLFLEKFDLAYKYLNFVDDNLSGYLDTKSSITANNTAAILALKVEMDYSKAMFHLKTALEYAMALGDSAIQCPTLCNMAAIYYERSDTAGLRYARRAYDIARKNNDIETMTYGAMHMSQANIVAGKFSEAKRYADDASRLLSGWDAPAYIAILRLIYGDIYQNIGELDKADSIYECFSADLERQEPGLILEYLNKKGNLLLREGRPKEAEGFFVKDWLCHIPATTLRTVIIFFSAFRMYMTDWDRTGRRWNITGPIITSLTVSLLCRRRGASISCL